MMHLDDQWLTAWEARCRRRREYGDRDDTSAGATLSDVETWLHTIRLLESDLLALQQALDARGAAPPGGEREE
jgi:hypothetical protein